MAGSAMALVRTGEEDPGHAELLAMQSLECTSFDYTLDRIERLDWSRGSD